MDIRMPPKMFVHWSCGRWDPTHQCHCGGCGWSMYPFSRSPLQFLSYAHILFFFVIIAVSFLWSLLLPLLCPTTLSCLYRALLRFLSHCGFLSNSFPELAIVSVDYGSFTKPVCVLSCDFWVFFWRPFRSFPVSRFSIENNNGLIFPSGWRRPSGVVNEPANASSVWGFVKRMNNKSLKIKRMVTRLKLTQD